MYTVAPQWEKGLGDEGYLQKRDAPASDQVEIHVFQDGSGLVADHHGHMKVVEALEE